MNSDEVTQQILGAWDEIVAEEEKTEEPEAEPQETEEEEEPTEEPAEEPEEEEAEEDEEETEEEAEEEAEEEPAFESEDPEIRAFMARYQGDLEKALKGSIELQRAFGRQGQEKAVLNRKVQELEGELANVRAFNATPQILSSEQQQWIGEALESGTPSAYVQEALKVGEFDLARAICTEWGREQPYEALRATQVVDQWEQQYAAAANAVPEYEPLNLDTANLVLSELVKYYPDIQHYSGQMAQVMQQLGDEHHLVVDARSGDPDRTVPALTEILDIARLSSHSLTSTRDRARNGNREEAASARRRATVASAGASPSPSEAPRSVRIGPGLTLEQLDEEWSRNT